MTRSTPALLLALLMSVGGPVGAAEIYDYAIDRFEADGNVHGPLDGTPDLVENFDDGTMGPTFQPIAGTSVESGGALHLQSPGASVSIPGVTPTSFETSAVTASGWLTSLQVGSGDMDVRIVMPPQPIGGNDGVNLLIQSIEDDRLYYAGVSIVNFDGDLAARNQPPVTPGLAILSHQEVISFQTGNQQLVLEDASIQATSITGDIVLALHYDDATHSVTATYSLDGGTTFAGAFAPLPIETSSGTATFYIASVAHAGECPAGAGVESLRLRGLGRPGYSGLALKASVGGNELPYGTLRIVVADDGNGGGPVFDVLLPDSAAAKCDPRDGWSYGAGRRKYKNYSNAFPPDCVPGSAQGLRQYESRWTGTNHVKLKAAKGSMPQLVGPARVAFYRGTGPVNECDGNVGVVDCLVKPGAAKCSFNY
jgi:hypothetical protein